MFLIEDYIPYKTLITQKSLKLLLFKYETMFPSSHASGKTDTYVGVIIAEVAATLILYIILKIVHFCIWGHLYVCKDVNLEGTSLLILSKAGC